MALAQRRGFLSTLLEDGAWVDRFYILASPRLYGFSSNDPDAEAVFEAALHGVCVEATQHEERDNCFALKSPAFEQDVVLSAESAESATEWMKQLDLADAGDYDADDESDMVSISSEAPSLGGTSAAASLSPSAAGARTRSGRYVGRSGSQQQVKKSATTDFNDNESEMSLDSHGMPRRRKNEAQLSAVSGQQVSTKKARHRVRKLVSKKKRRFVQDGFDLDLTYVTDRLIAMGFPSAKLEAMYRNKMSDVQRFFKTYHDEHYYVYNLCSERDYDPICFDDRVYRFPFDDHNCPPFYTLVDFCDVIDEFLCEHPDNVAALHCKAGKGRTGLCICAYLLHTGMWSTAEEALSYYGFARTKNQQGVTIPSQRRYVKYYERFVRVRDSGLTLPPPRRLRLKKLWVSSAAPAFDHVIVRCDTEREEAFNSKQFQKETGFKVRRKIKSSRGGVEMIFGDDGIEVSQDIRVQLNNTRFGFYPLPPPSAPTTTTLYSFPLQA
ncbi:MAG: hypothetical protein MHM6MM_000015 [Cercozoa sp. M6MM]